MSNTIHPSAQCTAPQDVGALDHGRKYDQGKPRVGLRMQDFARALTAVAMVTTFGAQKYAPGNWLRVDRAQERYTDAMYRHLLSEARGETYDLESGLMHAAHSAWNALARLELLIREEERVGAERLASQPSTDVGGPLTEVL